MSGPTWLRIGAVLGGLAVAVGAFGAHGLKGRLETAVEAGSLSREDFERKLATFQTGVEYQMSHALALVAVGLLMTLARSSPGPAASVAAWAFLVGVVLFSGSLYALVLSGQRWLGMITPFGGLAFLAGWIALAVAAGGRLGP